jgi:hypothetical protein
MELIPFFLVAFIFYGIIVHACWYWLSQWLSSEKKTYRLFIDYPFTKHSILIAEILLTTVAPIAGLLIAWTSSGYDVYDDSGIYTPIAHKHALTIASFYGFSILCYWVSKLYKEKYSPILYVLVQVGLLQGLLLAVVFMIQFGPLLFAGLIPILITFPLTAPLFAFFLFLAEIRRSHKQFRECQLKETKVYKNQLLQWFYTNLKSQNGQLIPFLLTFPFLMLQQLILTLFGQKPNSMIQAFTETCDWVLSAHPIPPMPPQSGHYLCTVASKGHSGLVNPQRKGMRGGRVIEVNRQLLVANAFENWLEIKHPKLHCIIRSNYDKVGIPVYIWVENKWLADLCYILMKPAEWIFLVWLYLVDSEPEKRIQSQYLGKKL